MYLILNHIASFILSDELITSCAQIRIGPSNLGYYGIFSSLVNGRTKLLMKDYFLYLVLPFLLLFTVQIIYVLDSCIYYMV